MLRCLVRLCLLAGALVGCVGADPMNTETVVADQADEGIVYATGATELDWRVVNDTVMGGRSRSQWRTEPDAYGIFEGVLSLENNGGFASVRSSEVDLMGTEHDAIRVKVRGDGRPYRLSLRTDRVGWGVSYQVEFPTEADAWIEVTLPLDAFRARWRGRPVDNAPSVRAADIRSVGFMLADKVAGPFRLDVAKITSITQNDTERLAP